ncbi:MAG: penicillin-binding protein 2 [Candidatus Roizmanbacteria bacterium]|nr:penicillin-binding protein 2 [Candidatus Roizmanbacteria bacterium]
MNLIRLAFLLFIVSFGFVIHRLFVIQVLHADKYIPIQKFLKVERVLSLRGEIQDVNHNPLAVNRRVYSVYGNTKKLNEDRSVADKIQSILKISDATMNATLRKNNWQKIASGIDSKIKDSLGTYYPTYLNLEEEWIRSYPEGSLSAHLLGFVGRDDVGNPQGYIGTEGYFEQELRGLPSVAERESDIRGVSLIGGANDQSDGRSGLTIRLTIDRTVQSFLESLLYDGVYQHTAKRGCGVVMEPSSGKIRAMACVPAFIPRNYFMYQDIDFSNPLISTVYEPGSTFKPLVVAMGLEEKKIKEKSTFDESGPVQIGEYAIRTWNNEYHGTISLSEVLAQSSNVGMVRIIQKVDKRKVEQYLTKLGLYEQTGIQLQGEALSLIKDSSEWYPIDYATISFGQGIAVTPIQLVTAFSTLANGGYLIPPTIVESMTDETGNDIFMPPSAHQRVFSPQTVNIMQRLLKNSVDKSEAKYPQKPEGYSFCGKTGTAQIPIEGHYDPDRTIASFIGYFPCGAGEIPKYLIFIMYREPEGSIYGSETAAPTFFEMAKKLILYYNIGLQRP